MSQKRPKGLIILAIINFFFAALLVPTLLIYIFAPQSLAEADVDLTLTLSYLQLLLHFCC